MQLKYREDWEEVKKRYEAWWAHDNTGRACIWVEAPLLGVKTESLPAPSPDPEIAWRDLEYHAIRIENAHKSTFYGGEAFPIWILGNPGHECIPAFLGCKVKLAETTGWLDPIWNGDKLEYEATRKLEDNPHYRFALKWQKFAVEEARGKSIPAICTALGGCGDSPAALRGSERLLYDVAEMPDEVKKADLKLIDLFFDYYSQFYGMAKEGAEGSTCWFNLWAPGKFYPLHNDFAYMISPKSFRNIFVETLEKQMAFLDYSVYHVDGEGNFNHLDAILEIKKLQAIQILPGAGKPSPLHYLPLLKKVQSAGKNLHIAIDPQEVETALELLSARGLFIQTWANSKAEAEALVRICERRSRA